MQGREELATEGVVDGVLATEGVVDGVYDILFENCSKSGKNIMFEKFYLG